MDRYKKPLSGIRQYSRLLDIFADGYTPDQIKTSLEQTLARVLENPREVANIDREHLIAEAINVHRLLSDPWAAVLFRSCLALHRTAYAMESNAALEECCRWQPALDRGMWHYWSAMQLEQPKGDLALEDFAAEAFRNIGDLLEATTQPYLRELLSKIRLSHQESPKNADQIEFGKVVETLAREQCLKDYMAPGPWNVPLNQLRNIAKHHDFEIEHDFIKARYGRGKRHEITLKRDDLWILLRKIFSIQLAVKTAHTIFIIDHRDEIRWKAPCISERLDVTIFNFASISASQGFELTEIDIKPECATAVLRDVTDMPPWQRQIHASQFVLNLWIATDAAECRIEYRQIDGTPTLITVAKATDCRAVRDELIDLREFSRRVTLQSLARCAPPEGWQEYCESLYKENSDDRSTPPA